MFWTCFGKFWGTFFGSLGEVLGTFWRGFSGSFQGGVSIVSGVLEQGRKRAREWKREAREKKAREQGREIVSRPNARK